MIELLLLLFSNSNSSSIVLLRNALWLLVLFAKLLTYLEPNLVLLIMFCQCIPYLSIIEVSVVLKINIMIGVSGLAMGAPTSAKLVETCT